MSKLVIFGKHTSKSLVKLNVRFCRQKSKDYLDITTMFDIEPIDFVLVYP